MPTRPVPTAPPRRPGLLRWTWPLLAALLLGAVGGVGVAAAIHMPRVDALVDYQPSVVTQLYDKDGQVFRTFARERRVLLKEGDISPVLQQAVLASEDSNFFQHGGIDAMGIARAVVADVRRGRLAQGASTIPMQLARMLFLSRERTWRRKIEEAFLAVELEKNYSKQQILTLYLNLVNLNHGNYGVEAASRYYFDKPAKDLSLVEAATLVGIIPSPSRYSPYRTPDVVRRQRDRVLRRMLDERSITPEQYRQAVQQPLLVATRQPQQESFAPYFAEDIRKHLEATYGADTLYAGGLQVATTLDPAIQRAAEAGVRSQLLRLDHRRGWRGPIAELDAADLAAERLPSWGQGPVATDRWYQGIVLSSTSAEAKVKIKDEVFTLGSAGIKWTGRGRPDALLDKGDVAWFRLEVPEEKAEKGKKAKDGDHAEDTEPARPPVLKLEQEPAMQAAAVVIESKSGAIRAMVGGWDFERNKFNRITQARRQVGSAFKVFVYGAAIEAGWTPSDTLLDAPTSFRGADGRLSYRPQNYYRKHYGIITLRRALELSVNVPAVKLLDLVGVRQVVDFAKRSGISDPLPPYPSLALGSADVTPIQLAAAYAAIANQGTWVEPYLIEKVATPEGQTLEQRFPNTHTVTDPKVAFVLTHMLEGVIDRGTATPLASLPLAIAGKTGTTDDYSDAWFVGFTPRYTILTWVGYDVKRSLGSGMSGTVAALPIWQDIAERGVEEGWLVKDEAFPVPPGVTKKPVEYYSGLLASSGGAAPTTGRTVEEAFVEGTEPSKPHDPNWSSVQSLPWYQQKSFYIPKQGEEMPGQGDAAAVAEGEGTVPADASTAEQEAPQETPPPEEIPVGEQPPPG